jgi:hypothetical protein
MGPANRKRVTAGIVVALMVLVGMYLRWNVSPSPVYRDEEHIRGLLESFLKNQSAGILAALETSLEHQTIQLRAAMAKDLSGQLREYNLPWSKTLDGGRAAAAITAGRRQEAPETTVRMKSS